MARGNGVRCVDERQQGRARRSSLFVVALHQKQAPRRVVDVALQGLTRRIKQYLAPHGPALHIPGRLLPSPVGVVPHHRPNGLTVLDSHRLAQLPGGVVRRNYLHRWVSRRTLAAHTQAEGGALKAQLLPRLQCGKAANYNGKGIRVQRLRKRSEGERALFRQRGLLFLPGRWSALSRGAAPRRVRCRPARGTNLPKQAVAAADFTQESWKEEPLLKTPP